MLCRRISPGLAAITSAYATEVSPQRTASVQMQVKYFFIPIIPLSKEQVDDTAHAVGKQINEQREYKWFFYLF